MSDKPLIAATSAERAMAANARSRVRQGKQQDLSSRAAAEGAANAVLPPDDATGPRTGRDTD
jgi:hypothetical protein